MRVFGTLLTVVTCVLAAHPARAQETRRTGISIGFPASVGFIFQVNDKLAIRPELNVSLSSSETRVTAGPTELETSADSTSFGTGVSALFYLRRWESLRTYFSPRFTFTRTTTEADSLFDEGSTERTSRSYGGSASFGAEYNLGDRFSVFGEVGVAVARGSSDGLTGTESKSTSFGTRSGAGVTFYF